MCEKLSLRCCTRVPRCVSCLREGSPCDQDLPSGLEHPSSLRPNDQLISDSVHLVRGNQDSERSSVLPKDTLLQKDGSEDLNPGPSDSRPQVSACSTLFVSLGFQCRAATLLAATQTLLPLLSEGRLYSTHL